MFMSSRTASCSWASMQRNASRPPRASTTSNPLRVSWRTSIARSSSTSSTTRTFGVGNAIRLGVLGNRAQLNDRHGRLRVLQLFNALEGDRRCKTLFHWLRAIWSKEYKSPVNRDAQEEPPRDGLREWFLKDKWVLRRFGVGSDAFLRRARWVNKRSDRFSSSRNYGDRCSFASLRRALARSRPTRPKVAVFGAQASEIARSPTVLAPLQSSASPPASWSKRPGFRAQGPYADFLIFRDPE